MTFFEKKDGTLVFNWVENMPNTWELGETDSDPHGTIDLIRRGSAKFIVQARLVIPKLRGKHVSGYNNKTNHKTEEKALAIVDSEKKHIEKIIMDTMGSDFVLKVLSKGDAVDYSIKGVSTCVNCGKKFSSTKKYHRYCDECGAKDK